MITYNHVRFIRTAMDSVLAQRVGFPIELIVGDDCSADGTREVIGECAARRPDVVKPLLHTARLGMHENLRRVLAACRGEFIAFLEGDDYWTRDDKIEKQVEWMRAHPGVSFSFHPVLWTNVDGKKLTTGSPEHGTVWPAMVPSRLDFEQVAASFFIQTAAVVCRRDQLPIIPKWVDELPWCDWALWLLLADRGALHCLPDVMSVYRQHPGGQSARMLDAPRMNDRAALMFTRLAREVSAGNRRVCRRMVVKHLELTAEGLEQQGHRAATLGVLMRAAGWKLRTGGFPGRSLRWAARLALPRSHRTWRRVRQFCRGGFAK